MSWGSLHDVQHGSVASHPRDLGRPGWRCPFFIVIPISTVLETKEDTSKVFTTSPTTSVSGFAYHFGGRHRHHNSDLCFHL